jgi:hypothetical protein
MAKFTRTEDEKENERIIWEFWHKVMDITPTTKGQPYGTRSMDDLVVAINRLWLGLSERFQQGLIAESQLQPSDGFAKCIRKARGIRLDKPLLLQRGLWVCDWDVDPATLTL